MNPLGRLSYHVNVSLLGNTVLRWQRYASARKLKRFAKKPQEHVAPPFTVSPRLKELISRHYLAGRYANSRGPVAWITSGAPIEFLKALGYYVMYPENHAAVCAIRKVVPELSQAAEGAGFSRDLCSYARTDIGSVLSGKTPVGRLPRPDLLVCCTNICQTVLNWYQVLAHHFKVPLIVVDTPFLYRTAEAHAVEFVKKQLDDAIPIAERIARRSLDQRRLEEVMRLSHEAALLWMQIMDRGRHRPAPITAFDEFIHMAPVVEMRGGREAVEYYRSLLQELDQRIALGIGALKHERKRVLWDNLPIWFRIRPLSELLVSNGVALVASTYTNAWGELADMIDPAHPLESMAKVYLHPILNRGTGHKLQTMKRMVRDFQVDGVILHSDRSCKPYSIGQMDQCERLIREVGVPALLLEADHNDPRAYSEEQSANRLQAFLEVLQS